MPSELLSGLQRHDRAVLLGALAGVVVAAWLYLLLGAGIDMEMMDMGGGQLLAMGPEWTIGYAALIFTMWVMMMVAMMLPSAAPTILLVAALMRDRGGSSGAVPATAALFASGYILVWSGFSLAAASLQWGLSEAGLLSETMALGNAILVGTVLVAAGVYQWTPFKDTCLRHCRSPAEFLVRHWRRGPLGAVRTGIRHGFLCLGCCWMLMALLFVGGLMNLAWVGAITLLVLVEKTMPWSGRMSRVAGALLAVWGAASLVFIPTRPSLANQSCSVAPSGGCSTQHLYGAVLAQSHARGARRFFASQPGQSKNVACEKLGLIGLCFRGTLSSKTITSGGKEWPSYP